MSPSFFNDLISSFRKPLTATKLYNKREIVRKVLYNRKEVKPYLNNDRILTNSNERARELTTLERFSFGNVSFKNTNTNRTSVITSVIAKIAGNQNQILADLSEKWANAAPIIGPTMKPNEKAIPTSAIPLPRFFAFDTSVIMAILSEILPLLRPPTKRANTNNVKFVDIAHIP